MRLLLPSSVVLGAVALLSPSAVAGQLQPSPAYTPPDATSGDASSNLAASEQWSNLLGNTLWFYEAQRSGKLPESNRVPWRNDSLLDDGEDVGLNLSGGYHDGGDYLKATYPLSLVLASISWAGVDYGAAFEQSRQTAYLDGTLRWGLDWLIKAHPEPSVLYVQVGNSTGNDYWGGDRRVPGPRTSYKIDADKPGTDVAASTAASFASAALLYSGQTLDTSSGNNSISLANASYATMLLTHATQLYDFAKTSPMQVYQTSVPAAADIYGSSRFADSLVWAALWLSVATNSSSYLTDASNFYASYKLSGSSKVLNWASKVPALPVLAYQIVQSRPWLVAAGAAGPSFWQAEAEKVLDSIAANDQLSGGLLWFEGDSNSGSLNPALNSAQLLFRYAPMATTSDRTSRYQAVAQRQLDYALGNNPMKAVYVVGQSSNSPQNPHSAPASGGSNISAIDTDPLDTAYVLYGAVVGGPGQDERFFDIRSDWPQTEVALDYNSPLVTLAAYSILNSPSTAPVYATLSPGAYSVPPGRPCDAVFPCGGKKRLRSAYIFAIAFSLFGLVFGAALFAAWKWLGWFRSKE